MNNKTVTYISRVLFYSFPLVSLIGLVIYGIESKWIDILGAFIYAIIAGTIIDKFSIDKENKVYIYLGLWLHVLGLLYFFNHFFYYDKIEHSLIGLLIALILSKGFLIKTVKKNAYFYLLILFLVLGCAAFWEIYEFIEDLLFGTYTQGVYSSNGIELMSPLEDSMLDLIFSFAGALIYVAYNLIVNSVNTTKD